MAFKYNPNILWVSHSSISDFIKCPKLYYLKNIYKDPKTGYKIQIARPATTMGDIVHKTIGSLVERTIPGDIDSINACYERLWKVQEGSRGGFTTAEEEKDYKARGLQMVMRFSQNWDLTKHTPIILDFPKAKIFDGAFLVGNVDWLEEDGDGLFLMDFKTGKNDENSDSLQLPIYTMLVRSVFRGKPVRRLAYWYLRETKPQEVPLPDLKAAIEKVKDYAAQMLAYRNSHDLTTVACPTLHSPSAECNQIQRVAHGEAKFLYQYHDYRKDVYTLT